MTGTPSGVIRVLGAVCDTSAILLLGFLIASRLFYTQFNLTRAFEFDRVLLIALAIVLLLLARAAPRLDARLLLAATMLAVSAGVAITVLILRSVDVAGVVKTGGMKLVIRQHDADIARPDERYGYVLRPNARDHQREPDYDVTYTVDAAGRRVTPSPPHPRTTIAFVGDSFTFGNGVQDTETYTSLLGSEYWRDVKVINAGVSGWGMTQAYLTIADMLASSAPPAAIVYQMIPDDIYRSYLREPVTTGVRRRLEFVDGRFVQRDVPKSTPAITPDLVEKEIQLARDLLISMQRACEQHHVPFAVLLLLDNGSYPPTLMETLGEHQMTVVDLTRIRYERFTHDYHPNAADHRRIAAAIASSAIAGMVGAR